MKLRPVHKSAAVLRPVENEFMFDRETATGHEADSQPRNRLFTLPVLAGLISLFQVKSGITLINFYVPERRFYSQCDGRSYSLPVMESLFRLVQLSIRPNVCPCFRLLAAIACSLAGINTPSAAGLLSKCDRPTRTFSRPTIRDGH